MLINRLKNITQRNKVVIILALLFLFTIFQCNYYKQYTIALETSIHKSKNILTFRKDNHEIKVRFIVIDNK